MLVKAREKLPGAHFVPHDLRQPWPDELDRRFDRIVSAYVFHHFDTAEKTHLCRLLVSQHMATRGRLVIGDISFANEMTMQVFARSVGELWEQELYWLADDCIPALQAAGLIVAYTQVSACAGVYSITINPTP
jgi:putative AdoMet-dependent methyltransferase